MMERQSYISAILFSLLFFAYFAFSAPVQITGFMLSSHPQQWRLIFESSKFIRYQFFTLKNPDRIVIDIDNAQLKKIKNRFLLIGTPVRNIRWAYRHNQRLRIVLDMKYKVKIDVYTLVSQVGKHYRLVVDLASTKKIRKSKYLKRQHMSCYYHCRIHKIVARDVMIVIDPGHGGKDPGTTGRGGTHEKTIVLAIAKDLQKIINQQRGFKAYLTRAGDYYITLRQRLSIARKYKADMFVSIHADAWKNHRANGASIFALSGRGATSEAARWLAARENESELMGGVNLSDKSNILRSVLINLSQTATIRASLMLGDDIIRSLYEVTPLHHVQVEQAAFVVLKSPDIPSLLIETGFLSNPFEEYRLKKSRYREQLAVAIMRGIREYFTKSPPPGTLLAQLKYRHKENNHAY